MSGKSIIYCPYCDKEFGPLVGEDNITIVCSNCNGHFGVNLKTQKVSRKRSGRRIKQEDDNDVPLTIELKCPYCRKYSVLNKQQADTIISVGCMKCKNYFRANLMTGRTWQVAPRKN